MSRRLRICVQRGAEGVLGVTGGWSWPRFKNKSYTASYGLIISLHVPKTPTDKEISIYQSQLTRYLDALSFAFIGSKMIEMSKILLHFIISMDTWIFWRKYGFGIWRRRLYWGSFLSFLYIFYIWNFCARKTWPPLMVISFPLMLNTTAFGF